MMMMMIWGLLFRGGSYLPFYSIKRWVPTPLGVYKLKVPTPLRHYNLNTVAPNQSPEINRKKPSDYKMAGADPPKRIHIMKQHVEHVDKHEGSMTYLLDLDIIKNRS